MQFSQLHFFPRNYCNPCLKLLIRSSSSNEMPGLSAWIKHVSSLLYSKWKKPWPNQNKEGQLTKNNFPVTQMLFVSVFPVAHWEHFPLSFLPLSFPWSFNRRMSIQPNSSRLQNTSKVTPPQMNKMHGTMEPARSFLPACRGALLTDCLYCLHQTNKSFKANRLRNCQIQLKAKLKKENAVYECWLKVTVIQHISTDCSFSILTFD